MRNRFLTIPVNEKGMEEYGKGIENSADMLTMLLPEEEFGILISSGAMDAINQKCGLLIDDYESEIIPFNKLEDCLGILEEKSVNIPTFSKAIKTALEAGTFVGIDF